MTGRYAVSEVRADGVPRERQRFDSLVDALDLRDELSKIHSSYRVVFFVTDADDEERGSLEHEDLYEDACA